MPDTTDPQAARFRHRSPEVEAVQWTGSNADQLRAFCGPDFDGIDLDDRTEGPDQTAAVREADHGTWRGLAPGDWVVRLDGGLYEFSAADFAKQYEPAAVSPPTAPDRAGRSDRYAAAIHDAMEPDLSLVDQEPGCQALFARAAEAAVALADTEQAELRRERDLAIAHDRQPYPTAWAYEQACKALRRKSDAIDRVLEWAAGLDDVARQVAGTEAVHPVAAHIRHLLDTQSAAVLGRVADEEQQAETPATPEPRHTCHDQKSAPGHDWECQWCSTLPDSITAPPAVVAEPGKENGS